MEKIQLPYQSFNAKRPGGLVGIITAALETLKVLYAEIGMNRGQAFEGCSECSGKTTDIDASRMIAPELSIKNGAVLLWGGSNCGPVEAIKALAKLVGIDAARPLAEQDLGFIDNLLYGYDKEPVSYVYKGKASRSYYRGCVNDLRFMRDKGTRSKGNLRAIAYFSAAAECPACGGSKLSEAGRAMLLQGVNYAEASRLPVPELLRFVEQLPDSLSESEREASREAIGGLTELLAYMNKIGLKALVPSFISRTNTR
ncbi:MAG: hypothetical protein J7559_07100 [Cohnella sp.]|nr:hypothetical protein [Cohnella sp.]